MEFAFPPGQIWSSGALRSIFRAVTRPWGLNWTSMKVNEIAGAASVHTACWERCVMRSTCTSKQHALPLPRTYWGKRRFERRSCKSLRCVKFHERLFISRFGLVFWGLDGYKTTRSHQLLKCTEATPPSLRLTDTEATFPLLRLSADSEIFIRFLFRLIDTEATPPLLELTD